MSALFPEPKPLSSQPKHRLVLNLPPSKGWRLGSVWEMGSLGLSDYHCLPGQLSERFLYLKSSAKSLSFFHNSSFSGCNIPVANCHPWLSSITYFAIYWVSVSQIVGHGRPAAEPLKSLVKILFYPPNPTESEPLAVGPKFHVANKLSQGCLWILKFKDHYSVSHILLPWISCSPCCRVCLSVLTQFLALLPLMPLAENPSSVF